MIYKYKLQAENMVMCTNLRPLKNMDQHCLHIPLCFDDVTFGQHLGISGTEKDDVWKLLIHLRKEHNSVDEFRVPVKGRTSSRAHVCLNYIWKNESKLEVSGDVVMTSKSTVSRQQECIHTEREIPELFGSSEDTIPKWWETTPHKVYTKIWLDAS